MSSALLPHERQMLAEVEEAAKQLSARVLKPFGILQKQLKGRGIDIRQHVQSHVYRAIAESHLLFGHAAADVRKLELCRWQLSAHDVLQTFGEEAAMSRDFVAEVARFGQKAEANKVDWKDAKAAMTRTAVNRRTGLSVPRGVPVSRMWTPWDVRQAMEAVGLLAPNRDARQQRRLVLVDGDVSTKASNLDARPATPKSLECVSDDGLHARVTQQRQAQSRPPPSRPPQRLDDNQDASPNPIISQHLSPGADNDRDTSPALDVAQTLSRSSNTDPSQLGNKSIHPRHDRGPPAELGNHSIHSRHNQSPAAQLETHPIHPTHDQTPPSQLTNQIDRFGSPVKPRPASSLLSGVTSRKRNRPKAQPLVSVKRRRRHLSSDSASSIEFMRKAEKPKPDFPSSPISFEHHHVAHIGASKKRVDHDDQGEFEYSNHDDGSDNCEHGASEYSNHDHDGSDNFNHDYDYDDDDGSDDYDYDGHGDLIIPYDSLYAAQVETPPKLQIEQSPAAARTKANDAATNTVTIEQSRAISAIESGRLQKTQSQKHQSRAGQDHFAETGQKAHDTFATSEAHGSMRVEKPTTAESPPPSDLDKRPETSRQETHRSAPSDSAVTTPTTRILHGLKDSNWISTFCVEHVLDIVSFQHVRVLHFLPPANNDWTNWATLRPFTLSRQHKIVLVPLLRQSHFTLLSFDLQESTVCHYDSLTAASSIRPIIDAIATRLGSDATSHRVWTLAKSTKGPQQPNEADCGVYMLATAMYLMADISVPEKHDGQLWRDIYTSLISGVAAIPNRLPDPAPPNHSNDLMDLATQCRAFTRVLREKLATSETVVLLFSMLSTKMEFEILALAEQVAPTRMELEQRRQALEQHRRANLKQRAADETIAQHMSSAIEEVAKEIEKADKQTAKQLEHRRLVFSVLTSLLEVRVQLKEALTREEAQFRETDERVRTKYTNYLAQVNEEQTA